MIGITWTPRTKKWIYGHDGIYFIVLNGIQLYRLQQTKFG
jgi:hypothetical protein